MTSQRRVIYPYILISVIYPYILTSQGRVCVIAEVEAISDIHRNHADIRNHVRFRHFRRCPEYQFFSYKILHLPSPSLISLTTRPFTAATNGVMEANGKCRRRQNKNQSQERIFRRPSNLPEAAKNHRLLNVTAVP